ncbi:hypothetical protein NDU88_001841 [Pleurodeles waltl]|uniref:Uncharacterized protein n=1 Tax=Pleurodeles waltl TaxID=8319 RepID=A0AAV7MMN0_PLEWA|nr:hypothetical protein NDU88_001841 [Pleurodeles waltl]
MRETQLEPVSAGDCGENSHASVRGSNPGSLCRDAAGRQGALLVAEGGRAWKEREARGRGSGRVLCALTSSEREEFLRRGEDWSRLEARTSRCLISETSISLLSDTERPHWSRLPRAEGKAPRRR